MATLELSRWNKRNVAGGCLLLRHIKDLDYKEGPLSNSMLAQQQKNPNMVSD